MLWHRAFHCHTVELTNSHQTRRLNWQLHFGEPPKWAPGTQFILVDPAPTERDAAKAAVKLRGDAAAVAGQLRGALAGGDGRQRWAGWRGELRSKVPPMHVLKAPACTVTSFHKAN